jgi:hypothetical protein
MAKKIKTPEAVVETVETLDAITPEVKGRGAIKLLLLAPVVAGVVGAVIHRKVVKPKKPVERPGAHKVIVS